MYYNLKYWLLHGVTALGLAIYIPRIPNKKYNGFNCLLSHVSII